MTRASTFALSKIKVARAPDENRTGGGNCLFHSLLLAVSMSHSSHTCLSFGKTQGTPLYSLAYGVAGGVILSGLVYAHS